MAVIIFMIMLTNLESTHAQFSSRPNCFSAVQEDTKCLAHEMSEKFEQLNAHIDKLEHKLEHTNCQTGTNVDDTEVQCPPAINDGADVSTLPGSCLDIYGGDHHGSGIYTIFVRKDIEPSPFRSPGGHSMQVYCDLDNDYGGPGWIVFQRRQDGSVNFTRLWNEYRSGFGDLNGEFWLENDNLALITGGSGEFELRVDLKDWEGEERFARYSSFAVLSESSEYTLLVGNYLAGNAGDSMAYHNTTQFYTMDRDASGCASNYNQAGFWYKNCAHAFLNNPYHRNSTSVANKGISWFHWHGNSYSLKFTEMKIRPSFN